MVMTLETGIRFKLDNVILGGDSRYWNIEVTVPTDIKIEDYSLNHREINYLRSDS